jgi:two-component system nitrate/nitrite response regulator NarL
MFMETNTEIGVLAVSEQTLLREGLRTFFAGSRYKIRHEANTIAEAIELADDQCDLVFIGSRLEKETIESIKLLRRTYPHSRIVLYAQRMQIPSSLIIETFGTSLDGCVMPNSSIDVLHRSLDLIMMGERVFPFNMLLTASGEIEAGGHRANGQTLSEREQQALNFLSEGRSNKFIARELHLSEATVKVHIKTLLRKIGCTNRTQAAIWSTRQGATGDGYHNERRRKEHDLTETRGPMLPGLLRGHSAK